MKRISAILTAGLLALAQIATAAEQVTYYHNDALGSPVAATDDTGSLLWEQHYGPWGDPLTPVAGDPRGYTGKPYDEDTDLQDFQARWYSASIGRFHAIDPAGFTESNIHSFNRYAYANNNPYRFVDPDGRFAISTLVAAAVWAGGAAWTAYDTYNTYQEDGAAAAAGTVAVDGAITFAGGAITKGLFKGTQRTWRYFKRTDDVPGEVAKNVVDPKRIDHIFRDKRGHMPDTPESRKMLENVANNPSTTLGKDKFGNTWSAQTRYDGTQVWTQTRDGKIINGGLNKTPRQFNPETGLSSPTKPGQ